MDKFLIIIEKILRKNFDDFLIKTTYLYNEFFISINKENIFIFFGISYKGETLIINKYKGEDTTIGKLLYIIIKKYNDLFIKYLISQKLNLFKVGEETDFINIFDIKKLNYYEIDYKLNFSFLDDYSYRRKIQNEFTFEDKSILDIYHSDYECSKCSGPKETFTSLPNFSENYDFNYFGEKNSKKISTYLYTNISDYESITIGGNNKINEILSNKEFISNYDMLLVNKTCISVIMGDDIESIFYYNEIPKDKILYSDQNIDSSYKAVINYLKNIKNIDIKKKKEILFFGLNKNKNTYEIVNNLEKEFGIKVGNILLPNINKKDIEEILGYKFAVFFSGREQKAQNIFKLYPIANIELKVPYGIKMNYTLYESILKKYGVKNYKNKLNIFFSNFININKDLYKKANKYQIGFIIQDYHVIHFLQDDFRGTTIISMLNDMGFHLNFFVHPTKNTYKIYIDEFNKKNDLDKNYNFNIVSSNKKEDLEKFLNDKKIQLYYSEISNDKRILGRNKEQFSIGDLEYAIEGFYKSFNILIKKCEKVDYLNNLI
ncbi:MAG: hypothetical protein PHN31_02750 [Candidatus Gracilibacteria bacterium]|nr:hypothetical protein [Candidatus Gracilibacteria bacterium]